MRYIIGTLNCPSAIHMSERDIRSCRNSFLRCALPARRSRNMVIEILVDSNGSEHARDIDENTKYTRLDIQDLVALFRDQTHPFTHFDCAGDTLVRLFIGDREYCAFQLTYLGILVPDEEMRSAFMEHIGAHEYVKEGDLLWLDSDDPGQLYRHNIARAHAHA